MTALWIVICVLFGTLTFIVGFCVGFLKGDYNRTQHGNERLEQGYEKGMKDVLSSAERIPRGSVRCQKAGGSPLVEPV